MTLPHLSASLLSHRQSASKEPSTLRSIVQLFSNTGDKTTPTMRSAGVTSSPINSGSSGNSQSLVYHLGGMCIRDYQQALQRSIGELKSREQQVNQLYSCLLDREETIAALNSEIDSLRVQLAAVQERQEQDSKEVEKLKSNLKLEEQKSIPIELPKPLPQLASIDKSKLLHKVRQDRLRAALAKNDLLGRLDTEQADGLIGKMMEERVTAGEVIIKEGEPGTRVFVMEDGEVDVHRDGQFLCRLLAPMVFGELAVIYHAPRSATVTAATSCRLWTIESKVFHKCMTRIRQKAVTKIAQDLGKISIFHTLSEPTLVSIVEAAEELHFMRASHVYIEPGIMYILTDGALIAPTSKCLCGETHDHQLQNISREQCVKKKAKKIQAVSCFCSGLSPNLVHAIAKAFGKPNSAIKSITDIANDLVELGTEEAANLRAAGDVVKRVVCYKLDTNYVVRALEMAHSEDDSSGVFDSPSKTALSEQTSDYTDKQTQLHVSNDGSMTIEDLSIIALLPSRDGFSHMFCVWDNSVAPTPRRNALVDSKNRTSMDHEEVVESDQRHRAGGCYIMRWIIRQRAEAAGVGERLNSERQHLLACRNSNFIVNLVGTLQDSVSVYFLYDSCLGGTLETLLRVNSCSSGQGSTSGGSSGSGFSLFKKPGRHGSTSGLVVSNVRSGIDEESAKFYLACTVEAVDFMHSIGIVHRNITPASIYITSTGYAKLGDFSWTKSIGARSRTFSLCGPVERLAPEVMLNKGHGLASDRWGLGILLYELLVGKSPFLKDDPMQTCSAILHHAGSGSGAAVTEVSEALDFPRRVSKPARDVVRKLCRAGPADRILIEDLRKHQFFTNFEWNNLQNLSMTPPFVPNLTSFDDISNIPGVQPMSGAIPVTSLSETYMSGTNAKKLIHQQSSTSPPSSSANSPTVEYHRDGGIKSPSLELKRPAFSWSKDF